MAEREPGKVAFDAFSNCMRWPKTWGQLYDDSRRAWAAVEAAIRADERERCAKVADRQLLYPVAGAAIASAIRQEPQDANTDRCEGCGAPATIFDAEDVPICRDCAQDIRQEPKP